MFKCEKCGGDKYYSKTNYPFGKKSKGRTTIRCSICNNIISKDYSKDRKGGGKNGR